MVTVTGVVAAYGPVKVARFAVAVLLYLALYALRAPLLLIARGLTALMGVVDQAVISGLSVEIPPPTPVAREATA